MNVHRKSVDKRVHSTSKVNYVHQIEFKSHIAFLVYTAVTFTSCLNFKKINQKYK